MEVTRKTSRDFTRIFDILKYQQEKYPNPIALNYFSVGKWKGYAIQELQTKIDAKLKFPTGYYITYGGAFENLNAAKDRLMIAVPVSLILIYILLFFAFNSAKQGLLIYSAIPLSAIGGIFCFLWCAKC